MGRCERTWGLGMYLMWISRSFCWCQGGDIWNVCWCFHRIKLYFSSIKYWVNMDIPSTQSLHKRPVWKSPYYLFYFISSNRDFSSWYKLFSHNQRFSVCVKKIKFIHLKGNNCDPFLSLFGYTPFYSRPSYVKCDHQVIAIIMEQLAKARDSIHTWFRANISLGYGCC